MDQKKRTSGPRAKCFYCGEIIQSKHRHDMAWCRCQRSFIDGGADYIRASVGLIVPLCDFCDEKAFFHPDGAGPMCDEHYAEWSAKKEQEPA